MMGIVFGVAAPHQVMRRACGQGTRKRVCAGLPDIEKESSELAKARDGKLSMADIARRHFQPIAPNGGCLTGSLMSSPNS